jgi:hypothetical protein
MTTTQFETNPIEQGLALIEETLLNNVSGGNMPACKDNPAI